MGTVSFTHTRFKNKRTGEMAYLLDWAVGWEAHTRISDGVKATLLEGAVQGSYGRAGKADCEGEVCLGKETVMRCICSTKAPNRPGGNTEEE